ncbi:hypothetical protein DOTSEDRAFT_51153 [Dothistroma septosporum NZE10]|uniref:ubiquitinyl hydrolase 1 n=1 Tax=Dothistroma septosporum (strain NZE10 / CBS 128990) TaxID=675120 RepID=N1PWF0_DOTSN|nr:hypothetical protein DOTSEDRAFT_51153 [Dothistroma septosporum NZE10]
MDPRFQLELLPRSSLDTASTLTYGVLLLCTLHFLLQYLDFSILSPLEILWNAWVYIIPTPLLLGSARRQELRTNNLLSQTHAAKGDALRSMLGLGGSAIMQSLSGVEGGKVMRRTNFAVTGGLSAPVTSDVPAGLGNWDNSCYQNSILQALSSLGSLRSWLRMSESADGERGSTTNTSLQETIAELQDPSNNGKHIWTPAKLKNMSSWQQQDAQEYFSKIMDELDKEAANAVTARETKPGLEAVLQEQDEGEEVNVVANTTAIPKNPLEGLVAQRVACTKCGFSEGYSMIPFNCLTVPLGSDYTYELEDCLNEYTKIEDIEGVECRSCTLLSAAARIKQLELPAELRGQIAERLQAIEHALEHDDFSDKTLKQDCHIVSKAFVNSTKTKEVVVGRGPQSLVVHVNRSVFDPVSGSQRKNAANVRFPYVLDLRAWMLSFGNAPSKYQLSAVVTHYGRHENGHYICYRRHASSEMAADVGDPKDGQRQESWWRLSDEDVSPVTESEVLDQGGVFMLFYERVTEPSLPPKFMQIASAEVVEEAAAIVLPPDDADDWITSATQTSSAATPSIVALSEHSIVFESDTHTDYDDESLAVAQKPSQQAPILKMASPTFMGPLQKDMKHAIGMSGTMMSV